MNDSTAAEALRPRQAPGWRETPARGIQRRWDGSRWTDEYSVRGHATTIDRMQRGARVAGFVFSAFFAVYIAAIVIAATIGGSASVLRLLPAAAVFLVAAVVGPLIMRARIRRAASIDETSSTSGDDSSREQF